MVIKGKYFAVGHGLTYGFKVGPYNVLFDINKNKEKKILQKNYIKMDLKQKEYTFHILMTMKGLFSN